MPNSSIEIALKGFIEGQEINPPIELLCRRLQEMVSEDPDINLAKIDTQYAVFRYGLDDLVDDVKLILNYKSISMNLVSIIINHIPSGELDFLKAYLMNQVRRESTWAIRLEGLLEQHMAFYQNSQQIIDSFRRRNDTSLIDSEVLKLANLTKRKDILDHLIVLKKMNIAQIKDNEQNYADIDVLIHDIEAIISMDYGLISEENVVEYKLAVSRLSNIWHIREKFSQELQSIHTAYALIRDYEQYDGTKIIEALQTLADINFVFETNNGPRPASEIISQIKACLEAKDIDQIISTSNSITSLYGLGQRVYRHCTERLLANQPKGSRVGKLLQSIRFWRGGGVSDLIEIIRYNAPSPTFRGITRPL